MNTVGCSIYRLAALLAIALSTGCAAPQSRDRTPVVIQKAKPGTAVVYFFRPEFDKVDTWARPALAIDERSVATLGIGAYTVVALTPGVHKVSLQAGPSDSGSWNQRAEFKVDDGVTYFVALWHLKQPVATPSQINWAFGLVGDLVYQTMNPPYGSDAPRLEFVERSDAEYALTGLAFVPPADDSMTVR